MEFPNCEPEYLRLFRVAAAALAAEDQSLRTAYVQGIAHAGGFYAKVSAGLAYWVTEPHLVYCIYKSWLPIARVRWEGPAYGDRKRADLVLYDDDEGKNVQAVLEAKWWNRDGSRGVRRSLTADVEKLLCARDVRQRFLLAFWWSARHAEEPEGASMNEINAYCATHGAEAAVSLAYKASFPTVWWNQTGFVKDAMFTMAALKVAPGAR
jgi:hypothetical protein